MKAIHCTGINASELVILPKTTGLRSLSLPSPPLKIVTKQNVDVHIMLKGLLNAPNCARACANIFLSKGRQPNDWYFWQSTLLISIRTAKLYEMPHVHRTHLDSTAGTIVGRSFCDENLDPAVKKKLPQSSWTRIVLLVMWIEPGVTDDTSSRKRPSSAASSRIPPPSPILKYWI